MRFLGHWLRPVGSVELCSLSERDTIKARKTLKLKCYSFMKSIALTYAHPEHSKTTHRTIEAFNLGRQRSRAKKWPRIFAQNERILHPQERKQVGRQILGRLVLLAEHGADPLLHREVRREVRRRHPTTRKRLRFLGIVMVMKAHRLSLLPPCSTV